MVYYFTSTVVDPPVRLYVGRDKVENEELIRYIFVIIISSLLSKNVGYISEFNGKIKK